MTTRQELGWLGDGDESTDVRSRETTDRLGLCVDHLIEVCAVSAAGLVFFVAPELMLSSSGGG
jgi:hypothetical protein